MKGFNMCTFEHVSRVATTSMNQRYSQYFLYTLSTKAACLPFAVTSVELFFLMVKNKFLGSQPIPVTGLSCE